jgi:hypothetical protein
MPAGAVEVANYSRDRRKCRRRLRKTDAVLSPIPAAPCERRFNAATHTDPMSGRGAGLIPVGASSSQNSKRGSSHPSMVDVPMGMPRKREPSMRQLRHLLRLHHGRVAARDAESCLSSSMALKIRTVEDPF